MKSLKSKILWIKETGWNLLAKGYAHFWTGLLAFCFLYLLIQYNRTQKIYHTLETAHQSLIHEEKVLTRKEKILRSQIQTLNQGPWYVEELVHQNLHLVRQGETVIVWKKPTEP